MAQARHKCIYDRTVRRTPQFFSGQPFFVARPPVQMTESGRMANAPLTKLLPMTLGPIKVLSTTLYTVKWEENGIQNTVCLDIVMLFPYSVGGNDVTTRDIDTQVADSRGNGDETDENDARIIEQLPGQDKLKHVRTC